MNTLIVEQWIITKSCIILKRHLVTHILYLPNQLKVCLSGKDLS